MNLNYRPRKENWRQLLFCYAIFIIICSRYVKTSPAYYYGGEKLLPHTSKPAPLQEVTLPAWFPMLLEWICTLLAYAICVLNMAAPPAADRTNRIPTTIITIFMHFTTMWILYYKFL
jgi:hypothetical protein